jgi:alkanesulfonate monooxygenase SsuD/methylene tetrahydromethanopterin reductase-like flavin-dependent oxidoreductase (luciferase family)
MALNMLCQEGHTDASVLGEHMAMGDLVEPLGFDSLFALEHHFTGYAMSPAPTQLLAYYAGRTKRIALGTAVIVLPWHDPVRVTEQIALLDIMCSGRCVFGFGRGAASVEYEGFRIPMEEARPRFVEAAQIVVKALANETFDWDGEFFKIPRTAIRPRPVSRPERRFYASSVSSESAEIIAKLGFGTEADFASLSSIHDRAGIWPERCHLQTLPPIAIALARGQQYGLPWASFEWQQASRARSDNGKGPPAAWCADPV